MQNDVYFSHHIEKESMEIERFIYAEIFILSFEIGNIALSLIQFLPRFNNISFVF